MGKSMGFILTFLLAAAFLNPLSAETDEARKAYDRMVEEATREADAYLEQKTEQQAQPAKGAQSELPPALAERAKAERKRLETEMDKVRERGLGPNFTLGMKEARLKELQEQMDKLSSDPQAYFRK